MECWRNSHFALPQSETPGGEDVWSGVFTQSKARKRVTRLVERDKPMRCSIETHPAQGSGKDHRRTITSVVNGTSNASPRNGGQTLGRAGGRVKSLASAMLLQVGAEHDGWAAVRWCGARRRCGRRGSHKAAVHNPAARTAGSVPKRAMMKASMRRRIFHHQACTASGSWASECWRNSHSHPAAVECWSSVFIGRRFS